MENNILHIDTGIEELIVDYFVDGLDESGIAQLQQWIDQSPDNRRYFQNMQEIWFASVNSGNAKNYDKKEAYRRFLRKTATSPQIYLGQRKNTFLRFLLYGAVSVILILIIAYLSYLHGAETLKNQFANIVIEAPLGSRTKMYLPDGSLVWLNASSKISYSQGFGVNNRKISLTGEGYFEVTKNEKLPFQVRTDELHTDVVGTKFNFRNYPEEEEATVSLLDGKVLVKNILKDGDNIYLSPDQKVFLNKKSGEMRMKEVKSRYTMEWTNGYLFFDEELLVDIVKILERSYNVKIKLKDESLKSFRFYANFMPREQTIDEILGLLESTGKIIYEKTGEEIILSSR